MKIRFFVGRDDPNPVGFMHWCPGCEEAHGIWFRRSAGTTGPTWAWDGNKDAPTTSPSIRCYTIKNGAEVTLCHYHLKAGMIEFCGDCPHHLNGQTVPLPDWPYEPGTYSGIIDEA